jgi:hypothetical protein
MRFTVALDKERWGVLVYGRSVSRTGSWHM